MSSLTAYARATLCLLAMLSVEARGDAGEAPFPIPDRYSLVNDYHGFLTIKQKDDLYEKLRALEKKNGTQIVLLLVPTTGATPICAYAHQAFGKWDVGHNGDGNGVLFLISGGQGRVCIVTGPGIGGALPDIKLRHIYYEHLDPHFRKQEFIEGINETIDALVAATHGEETAAAPEPPLVIEVTRDALIATLFGVAGLGYAGFLGWRWHRRRKTSKERQHA